MCAVVTGSARRPCKSGRQSRAVSRCRVSGVCASWSRKSSGSRGCWRTRRACTVPGVDWTMVRCTGCRTNDAEAHGSVTITISGPTRASGTALWRRWGQDRPAKRIGACPQLGCYHRAQRWATQRPWVSLVAGRNFGLRPRLFIKTALWGFALRLGTDKLRPSQADHQEGASSVGACTCRGCAFVITFLL